MGKYFSILLISSAFAFVLYSCDQEKEKPDQFSQQRVKRIVDSIANSNMIACFYEDGGLSVMHFENKEAHKARKLVYRSGYALFIDSLVYIRQNEFRSPRSNTNYLIKDSTVISIQQAKIIHPSSNWQGQTPWQQPYITIYKS
ncbi:MAG: hypothetical protein IPJ60_13840 [Sphingobacteriaceae bacterium]|nr:hypothetical protein [Sphingobacteriaceae bacterium]